jgi:hypothetical protein
VGGALHLQGDAAREFAPDMDFHVTSIVVRQGQIHFEHAVAGNDQDLRELVLGDDALLRKTDGAQPAARASIGWTVSAGAF